MSSTLRGTAAENATRAPVVAKLTTPKTPEPMSSAALPLATAAASVAADGHVATKWSAGDMGVHGVLAVSSTRLLAQALSHASSMHS